MEDFYNSSTYMVLHGCINNTVFYLPESGDWESEPEKETSNINLCQK